MSMIPNEQIIIYVLAAVVLLLIVWLIRTEIRLRRLFRGKKSKNLEGVITSLVNELKGLQKSKKDIEAYMEDVERRLKRSIQGIGTVRFNPFKDSGGNQSFAIALLDENGNGAVISTLYARERVSVFAKPIKNHSSEYELTAEEKQALKKARLS